MSQSERALMLSFRMASKPQFSASNLRQAVSQKAVHSCETRAALPIHVLFFNVDLAQAVEMDVDACAVPIPSRYGTYAVTSTSARIAPANALWAAGKAHAAPPLLFWNPLGAPLSLSWDPFVTLLESLRSPFVALLGLLYRNHGLLFCS
eukprot:365471-Chlamydomonas_euryale.AAC.7